MRRGKVPLGFTLIEMIVALLLSSLVLIGLIDVSSNMVQRQFEGIRYGRVDSQTLLSLAQMSQVIEAATYLNSPVQGSPSPASMTISGCSNYSSTLTTQSPFTGQINSAVPITWFAFCVKNYCTPSGPNCVASQGPYDLEYHSGLGCAPSCVGGNLDTLVYQSIWLEAPANNPPFSLNQTQDGVDIHFDVGNPNPTAMQKTPVVYPVDTAIIPNDGHFQ